MMNKNEWKKVKLENVCDILDNKRIPITASKRKKGVYPYYGANGIQDYVDDYIFNDELILLAEDGGNFGSKTKPIAYRVSGKCWVNNHAHVLKAKENFMISDFLCYSLMFYDVTKIINGATRLKLTQSAMRNMLVPLPELREQEKIVKKLQCIEEILKKKEEQIKYLENLVKFQFLKMFGDPILNEKNWKKVSCKEIISKIGSGSTPLGGNKNYKSKGISFIRSLNVHNNKFINDGLVFIDEKQSEKLKNVNVEKDDILFNITGASVARSCIVPLNILPARVNQHVSIIRCNKEIIKPIFLCSQLTNIQYQSFLLKIAKNNGATREALTKEQLENLNIILPPIELQNKFADFVKQVDKSKVELQKSIDETQLLFDSLMDKYFG